MNCCVCVVASDALLLLLIFYSLLLFSFFLQFPPKFVLVSRVWKQARSTRLTWNVHTTRRMVSICDCESVSLRQEVTLKHCSEAVLRLAGLDTLLLCEASAVQHSEPRTRYLHGDENYTNPPVPADFISNSIPVWFHFHPHPSPQNFHSIPTLLWKI